MTHQGRDVQLTAYAARDWRANFYRSASYTPSSVGQRGRRPLEWDWAMLAVLRQAGPERLRALDVHPRLAQAVVPQPRSNVLQTDGAVHRVVGRFCPRFHSLLRVGAVPAPSPPLRLPQRSAAEVEPQRAAIGRVVEPVLHLG